MQACKPGSSIWSFNSRGLPIYLLPGTFVSSYLTISTLPVLKSHRRCIFCGTFHNSGLHSQTSSPIERLAFGAKIQKTFLASIEEGNPQKYFFWFYKRFPNQKYKNVKWAFTVAFLLYSAQAVAQHAAVPFHTVSLNDGLSQSSVVDITFDTKGFVWLATQDGLNRYDGKGFWVADKRFDDITSGRHSRLGKIMFGGKDFLWIVSRGGQLERFNLINNAFQSVPLFADHTRQVVTCLLAEANEQLWIGTESGKLLHYDDQQQRLWVIGEKIGYLDGSRIRNIQQGPDKLERGVLYSCLAESKNGDLWLGSWGNGLFLKKKDEPYFRRFRGFQPRILPADLVIETILVDQAGKIWIGTYGKGLFIVEKNQVDVRQFVNDKRNPSSIAFNDILSIKQDGMKGVWIGTDGGGLSYFNENRNRFILFNNQTVPENVEIALVRSITTDRKGRIWAGTTNKGLTRIDFQKYEYKTWKLPSYQKDIYNPDRIVSLFNDPKDVLWVGTQGNGLILFDTEKEKIIKWFHPDSAPGLKLPDGTIWCIYYDSGGRIWLGTGNSGLCLMNKQKGLVGQYKPGNGNLDAIRAITSVNDSMLCIAFEKTGLLLFNNRTKVFSLFDSKALNAFFSSGTNIKCLYYQSPVLWIGTAGKGLVRYDSLNGQIKVLTEKDGLPNNTVYGILSDGKGYLWLSSNKGLSRFNESGLLEFTNYTAAQGLQSNEFNTGAFYKSPDGMMLFGGIEGLNIFDPSKFSEEDKTIPVVFTKIQVDNESVPGDTSAVFKKIVPLTYKNHSV
eukprot:gene20049-23836_t